MLARFWIGFGLFHAGLIAASVALAWRFERSLAARRPWRVARDAAASAAIWLASALVLAAAAAAVSGDGFTAVRFLSQALFGELIALASWLAVRLWRSSLRAAAATAALAALVLLSTYAEAYHREPTDLQVRRYALDLSRGQPARGRLRVLHLSDIQADRVTPYLERALRTAAAEKPDIVLMTGDYVQPRIGSPRAPITADVNALLRRSGLDRAPLGAFAVRGDTDRDWPRVLDGTGIRPLDAETVSVPLAGGARLSLTGLTPGMSHGRQPAALQALVAPAPRTGLRLVLGHGPDFVMALPPGGADLALAGHTHGGQIALPLVGALYTKTRLPQRYGSGLHDYAGTKLHVSAGVGMERGTAPQVRFLCPPEISVLELRY
jgi:predicted MPP superfamily phosphohydrolase